MPDLRNRRQNSSNVSKDDEDNLTTPLLSPEAEPQRTSNPTIRAPPLPSAPPPFHFYWLAKLETLWHNLLDWVYWNIWRRIRPHPPLSILQISRFEELEQKSLAVFDPIKDSVHQRQLEVLWHTAFDSPFPANRKSSRWQEMGWQGADPLSDVRGGGALAVDLLTFMAEERTDDFLALMRKDRRADDYRSDYEYPFAAAGINVAHMLVQQVLRLSTTAPPLDCNATVQQRGFMKLLSSSDIALETMFVESFLHLDRVWVHQKASYFDFNSVLIEAQRAVETSLSRRWLETEDDFVSILMHQPL